MINYRNNQTSITGLQEQYVQESIDFIREHEPPEGYFVGFSGGKDSIVTMKLVKMAGAKYQSFYSCTGIDPPEIYKFIRKYYPEVIWKYPKMTFWEGIRKKGVPTWGNRWCCDVLKKDPTKNILLNHRIVGIRAEESFRRLKRGRISPYGKWIIYSPILNWLEWQIWEFIETNRLPYPSLYDEGFDRIGCIICPFLTGGGNKNMRLKRAKDRWPKTYIVFEKVVSDWYQPNKYRNIETPEEFLDFWYSG